MPISRRKVASRAVDMRLYSIVGKPIIWFGLPIVISFASYFVPQEWYGRHWLGYTDVDYGYAALSLAVVYCVFGAIILLTTSVVDSAVPLRPAQRNVDQLTYVWLTIVTVLGGIGALSAFGKAVANVGLAGAWDLIAGGLANELKMAMYEDYSVGVLSLRYLVVLATPASLAIAILTREWKPAIFYIVPNVFFTLLVSLLSSRLTLVASVVVLTMIMARYGARFRLKLMVPAALAILAALIVLSNTRNINYYQEIGVNSPILAGLADTLTYLSSPFHGSLFAADKIAGSEATRSGIQQSLNTNSAIIQHVFLGPGVYIYFGIVLIIGVSVFYSAYKSRRLELIAGGAAASYAFWEFWRLNLFFEGIHLVWITFGILLPLALQLLMTFAGAQSPSPVSTGRPDGGNSVQWRRNAGMSAGAGNLRKMPRRLGSTAGGPTHPVRSPGSVYRGLPEFQVSAGTVTASPPAGRFGVVSSAIMAERRAQAAGVYASGTQASPAE